MRADVPFSIDEKRLLAEAKQRGEEVRRTVESTIVSFGQWLLVHVFGGDAAAAHGVRRTENRVWRALVDAAGGPTLRLNRRLLYVSLALAVYDRRIGDQSWQNLDIGRKELLLPLRADDELREGAQHVARFNLSQDKTREYVAQRRAALGKQRLVRLTPARLAGRLRALRQPFVGAQVMKRVAAVAAKLDDKGRKELLSEVAQTREALRQLERALKG